jgi:steroid 5-alpha reductase family enzyme
MVIMTTVGAVDLGWMMSRQKQGKEGDDLRWLTFRSEHGSCVVLRFWRLCSGVALTLPGKRCAAVDRGGRS